VAGDAVPAETRAPDAAGCPAERVRPPADLACPPAFAVVLSRPASFRERARAPAPPPRAPVDFAAAVRLPVARAPRGDSAARRVVGVPLLAGVAPGVVRVDAPDVALRAEAPVPRPGAFPAGALVAPAGVFFEAVDWVRPEVRFVDGADARPAVFFVDAADVRPEVFFVDAADARPEVFFIDAVDARPGVLPVDVADVPEAFFVVVAPLPALPTERFVALVPAFAREPAPLPAAFLAPVPFDVAERFDRLPSPDVAVAFLIEVRPPALFMPARPAGVAARVFSPVVVAMGFSVSRRGADCAHVSYHAGHPHQVSKNARSAPSRRCHPACTPCGSMTAVALPVHTSRISRIDRAMRLVGASTVRLLVPGPGPVPLSMQCMPGAEVVDGPIVAANGCATDARSNPSTAHR
jgi:hypothetical protein